MIAMLQWSRSERVWAVSSAASILVIVVLGVWLGFLPATFDMARQFITHFREALVR